MRTALLGLSLLAACAAVTGPLAHGEARSVSVLITNGTISSLAIYASPDRVRVATVRPGSTQCVRMRRADGDIVLYADPVGSRRLIFSPAFNLGSHRGWRWRIGSEHMDRALDLTPLEPACGVRRT